MSIPFLLGSRITLLFNARVINNVSVQIKYPEVIMITVPWKFRLDNARTFFIYVFIYSLSLRNLLRYQSLQLHIFYK